MYLKSPHSQQLHSYLILRFATVKEFWMFNVVYFAANNKSADTTDENADTTLRMQTPNGSGVKQDQEIRFLAILISSSIHT